MASCNLPRASYPSQALPALGVDRRGIDPAAGNPVSARGRGTHDRNDTGTDNVLDGCILRRSYLGEARDYLIGIAGTGLTLRVVTSAAQVFRPDNNVRLTIPADACRIIP